MKRGAPNHPKLNRLAKSLGIRKREAIGIVELLHHFTDEYAWRGDVGRFPDDEIADRVDWDGDPAQLIRELVGAGLLDEHPLHRLVVHDWPDHCPEYTRKKVRGKTEEPGPGWAVDDKPPEPEKTDSGKFQNPPENSGLPRQGKARQGRAKARDGRAPAGETPPEDSAPAPPAAGASVDPPPAEKPKGKRRGRAPSPDIPAPDQLSPEDMAKLREWLPTEGLGWFESELPRKVAALLDWGRSKGELRKDWLATIRNAIRNDAVKIDGEQRERIVKATQRIQTERYWRERERSEPNPTPAKAKPAADAGFQLRMVSGGTPPGGAA